MLSYPNAKINLGLFVTEKRNDGYHNLETVFVPVPWYDALEIVPAARFKFSQSGNNIVEGNQDDNLILKVYSSMKEAYQLPPVEIILHKNIPMGGGLGGGSADAAFTATILNDLFSLKLAEEALEDIVRPLGSDCAFFIRNKITFAFGKGDQFEPLNISLKGMYIVLVYPGIHVSTAQAYSGVKIERPASDLRKSLTEAPEEWRNTVFNSFEASVFNAFPEIESIKKKFYEAGAVYASMSGSGSTVFGLFKKETEIGGFPVHYRVQQGSL